MSKRDFFRLLMDGNSAESSLVFCWVDFSRCRDNWEKSVTPEWRDTLRIKVQGVRKAVAEYCKQTQVAKDMLVEIDAWLIGVK